MVEAELRGIPAAIFTSIVDSHYVTAETLQQYAPIVNYLLELKSIDLKKVHNFKSFKKVLKEENNRGHNIFN